MRLFFGTDVSSSVTREARMRLFFFRSRYIVFGTDSLHQSLEGRVCGFSSSDQGISSMWLEDGVEILLS
jgi:hypothetical protein